MLILSITGRLYFYAKVPLLQRNATVHQRFVQVEDESFLTTFQLLKDSPYLTRATLLEELP